MAEIEEHVPAGMYEQENWQKLHKYLEEIEADESNKSKELIERIKEFIREISRIHQTIYNLYIIESRMKGSTFEDKEKINKALRAIEDHEGKALDELALIKAKLGKLVEETRQLHYTESEAEKVFSKLK